MINSNPIYRPHIQESLSSSYSCIEEAEAGNDKLNKVPIDEYFQTQQKINREQDIALLKLYDAITALANKLDEQQFNFVA